MSVPRRRRRSCLALVIFLAAATACSSGGHAGTRTTEPAKRATSTTGLAAPTRSSGCARAGSAPRGTSDHTIRSGGQDRVYELDVPDNYDGSTPYALVLGLHSLTVSYKFVPSMAGFSLGAQLHFIGVSPSGLLDAGTPYWDAAPTRENYDVTFISDLLDSLESTLCIDTSKVFSTGMSNGAQMSSLLACRLSNRIRAIAPISGEEYLAPCDGHPVPIMAFHGTADPILPYAGGGLNATHIAQLYHYNGKMPPGLPAPLGIDASMRLWAAHNGCDQKPVETRVAPHVMRRSWHGCRAATVLYIIEGGGHSWPGQPMPAFEKMFGPGTTEINATKLMFSFFFDHRT